MGSDHEQTKLFSSWGCKKLFTKIYRLISIAESFHYGQFKLVKVFGYHSYSVDLLVTTV